MTVRQQYSVEAFQSDPQGLLTEVRRSVNQHVPAAAGDQHRGTQPLIARIVRLAHAARASERGDAHGSTRSKDRDFYRSGRHVESNDTNRYAEPGRPPRRSEEHTSELQSHSDLVCRLLLEKKKR